MADLVLDPETMSLDDLRKAAEAEALAASTDKSEEKQAPIEVKEEVKDVAGPFYSERTIDLGDGAGVQVFKGKGTSREEALEDLTDKLADAQKHATKKIRELSKTKPVEKVINKDDEALLAAELLASPSAALDKAFRARYGDPEDIKQAVAESKRIKEIERNAAIGKKFIDAHPEYVNSEHNIKRFNAQLRLNNDFSYEGFEKAYTDLAESGLLQVKDAEAGDGQKKADAEAKRIADAAEAESSQRTRKASGLSTQRRSAAPTPAEPTEDEMESLSLSELRKLANRQLAGR